jgi:hypothetical protein
MTIHLEAKCDCLSLPAALIPSRDDPAAGDDRQSEGTQYCPPEAAEAQ